MALRCPACGAELEIQEQLEAHTREEHEAQQTSGFRCPACGAEFEARETLDAHKEAEHAA